MNLDNVTLITVDGTGTDINAAKALKYSLKDIAFKFVKLLTPSNKIYDYCETVIIEPITSMNGYNKFCLTDLKNYVDTEYCLLIQSDGFIINANKWCDNFYNYDYIGAPWHLHNLKINLPRYPLIFDQNLKNKKQYQIGNGGFSFRSKKLLKLTNTLYKDLMYGLPEDLVISILLREELEKHGIKFTDNIDLAAKFSCEATNINNKKYSSDESFGFHCKGTHPDKIKLLDLV
jgi:hypothetical protein